MAEDASPRPLVAKPGDVVAGKYELLRVLGEGGMGVVFEANHVRLRQRVALKMLLPEMLAEQVVVSRFEREARAAAQLRSRHVARVMDVDVTDTGMPYMVMELLHGHDLDAELAARGRIPYAEAVDYLLQACGAMHEAHGLGIVHRDLKPSNLFLESDGGATSVKVLDFGISKLQGDADKLTAAGAIMGTAYYMSPEQVRSAGNVDARSDIWALGVILYELLCGEPPFVGTTTQVAAAIVTEDPKDLRARCLVPGDLASAIERALRRAPDERYADVRAFAAALLPHAPAGSLGLAVGEALARGGGGRGSSLAPTRSGGPVDGADTEVDARPAPSATAPGWTQGGAAPTRSRRRAVIAVAATLAVAAGIAVGVGSRADRAASVDAPPSASSAVTALRPPPAVPEEVAVTATPDGGALAAPSSTAPSSPRLPRPRAGASSKPAVAAASAPPQLPPPPIPRPEPKTTTPPKPGSGANPLTL